MQVFAFFLLVAVVSVHGQTTPWTQLLTVDCNGVIHLPLGINVRFTGITDVYTLYENEVKKQALVACPDLSSEEMANLLTLPRAAVYLASGGSPALSRCANLITFPSLVIENNQAVLLNLPSTCTLAQYASSGCSFTMNFPDQQSTGSVIVQSCPNTGFPYISASLSGPFANTYFKPCTADSECDPAGRLYCIDPLVGLDTSFWTNFMSEMFFTTSSCTAPGFSQFFSTILTNFWAPYFGIVSSSSSTPFTKVCAPRQIFTNGSAILDVLPTCTSQTLSSGFAETLSIQCPFANGPSTSSLSNAQMSGEGLTSPTMPTCVGTAQFTCDGTIALYLGPRIGFAATAGVIHSFAKTATAFFKNTVQQCLGSAYTDASFWRNYAFWAANGYFARFSVDGQASYGSTILSQSPIGYLYSKIASNIQVNMPAACNYQSFLSSGTCQLLFSGLTSLLQTNEMDGYVQVGTCEVSNVPSFTLNLKGPLTTALSPPNTCTDTCQTGVTCENFKTSTALANFMSIDMWTHVNKASNLPGSLYQLLVNYFAGTESAQYGTSLCFFPVDYMNTNADTWSKGMAQQTAPNVYTVNDLTTFTEPFQCPSSQFQPTAASSTTVISWM